jgi:hypothetical protein
MRQVIAMQTVFLRKRWTDFKENNKNDPINFWTITVFSVE